MPDRGQSLQSEQCGGLQSIAQRGAALGAVVTDAAKTER